MSPKNMGKNNGRILNISSKTPQKIEVCGIDHIVFVLSREL
jgi:hypothetical protein